MEAVEGIIYPYALDKAGLIVKAVDAPRSEIYSCIACGERMVVRRGEIKRPYFAHYTENPNCKPETVLHMMAKDIIKAGLDTAIKMKYEYPFTWWCPVCHHHHKGDLARSTRDVKTEVSLDGVRPDILVSSTNGKPLVAIEVVVTHSPEQEAIQAYKKLKLPVLLIRPRWEHLENLKSGLGLVEAWQAPCKAKRCPKCHRPMEEVVIGGFAGYHCDKCGKPLLALGLVSGNGGYFSEWTPGIVKVAHTVGVNLTTVPIEHSRKRIGVLKCPACGYYDMFEWIYDPWFDDVAMTSEPPVKTKPYYRCQNCDLWIDRQERALIKKKGSQLNDRPETLNPPTKGERNKQ